MLAYSNPVWIGYSWLMVWHSWMIRERWGDVYADRVAETTKYKCVVTTQNEGGWDATRGVVNGGVLRIVCQNPLSNDLVSYILVCTDI